MVACTHRQILGYVVISSFKGHWEIKSLFWVTFCPENQESYSQGKRREEKKKGLLIIPATAPISIDTVLQKESKSSIID